MSVLPSNLLAHQYDIDSTIKVAVIYPTIIVKIINDVDNIKPQWTNANGYENGPVPSKKVMIVADPAQTLIGFNILLSGTIEIGASREFFESPVLLKSEKSSIPDALICSSVSFLYDISISIY